MLTAVTDLFKIQILLMYVRLFFKATTKAASVTVDLCRMSFQHGCMISTVMRIGNALHYVEWRWVSLSPSMLCVGNYK